MERCRVVSAPKFVYLLVESCGEQSRRWLAAPSVPFSTLADHPVCLRPPMQVAELAPGMDSRHVWDEASLLRTCVHRRLVALLGVACQVPGVGGAHPTYLWLLMDARSVQVVPACLTM